MRTDQRGFFFLIALFTMAGLLTLTTVGMGRSMTDLVVANRFVEKHQAFHLAEAGLDAAITDPALLNKGFTTQAVELLLCNGVLLTPDPPDDGHGYTLTVSDNDDADDRPCKDTDHVVVLKVTGRSRTTEQTIQVTLELKGPGPFYYAVAGETINLDGYAEIGGPGDRVPIYVEGHPDAFLATGTNTVYASELDIHDGWRWRLEDVCPRCDRPSIFPGLLPDRVDPHAARLSPIEIDLRRYYKEALKRRDENHIWFDQILTNKTLYGVVYVECGVNLEFDGNSTVNGTIVHEGCGGRIKIGQHGKLTINSYRRPPLEPKAFSRGLAIIGEPDLEFKNGTTVDITGFVMYNGRRSTIASDGVLRGGVIAIDMASLPPEVSAHDGPGPLNKPIVWGPLSEVHLNGPTRVLFQEIPQGMPGNYRPTILAWQVDNSPN